MNEFIMIHGKWWPVDTDTQQKIAARELSKVGINQAEVWRGDVRTHLVLLADTDVDPVANGTSPVDPKACQRLLTAHAADVRDNHYADNPPWMARHIEAWQLPVFPSDIGIKKALQAFACFAEAYSSQFTESRLSDDGYFSEHARDMLKAVHAWLNIGDGVRKLDSGAISRLITQLAVASGLDPDDV